MAKEPKKVIEYNGSNSVLAHKCEITDFKSDSLLIVDQSQQALFYKDGQVEGPFTAGRYTLPTSNILTFRQKFARLFSSDKDKFTKFSCDVYFVNTVQDVPIKWGTHDRFLVKDPVYSEIVNVGAYGSVKVKVSDPTRFVVSIVGTMGEYNLERLSYSVRTEINTVLKTYLSSTIIEQNTSLLEIQLKLMELSAAVEGKLNERLADYGITALHFNIEDISVDDASKARLLEAQKIFNIERNSRVQTNADVDRLARMSEAQLVADYNRTVMMGEAQARARAAQGYTYADEQHWKTQQAMASNPGFVRAGTTLPGMVPPQAASVTEQQVQTVTDCPKCGCPLLARTTVCPNCGYDIADEHNDK
ncbi:MAG: SPFH domain-containing protein [Clostridiales bacterium]|nr:SPFH domain-containing protein [Clostridiales bacterium]